MIAKILQFFAALLFIVAAIGLPGLPPLQLVAAGLACWVAAALAAAFAPGGG